MGSLGKRFQDPVFLGGSAGRASCAKLFLKSGFGDDPDKKVEDGTYFIEELEILRAAA